MKGNETLLTTLDQRLANQFTAINNYLTQEHRAINRYQYIVNSDTDSGFDDSKLNMNIKKQEMDEEQYAEWLIKQLGIENYLTNQPKNSDENSPTG